jgi:hypothetical protein
VVAATAAPQAAAPLTVRQVLAAGVALVARDPALGAAAGHGAQAGVAAERAAP